MAGKQQAIDDRLRDIEDQMISSSNPEAIAVEIVNGVANVLEKCIPNIYLFDDNVAQANDPGQNPFTFLAATSSSSGDPMLAAQIKLGNVSPRWIDGGEGPGLGAKTVGLWRRDKEAFVVVSNVADPDSEGSESAKKLGVKTTACLPLAFGGRILGVLYLHFTEPHIFTEDEKQAVQRFGKRAAIAIDNALDRTGLAGPSYVQSYGKGLIEALLQLQGPRAFQGVRRLLFEWAREVESLMGNYLAELMEDTISKLGRCLDMPDSFMAYYMKEYKKREGALQSIAGYREHFVHPFHVFVLGFVILAHLRDANAPFPTLAGRSGGKEELKAWFATAMYHDIGYPVEKVERLIAGFLDTSFDHDIPCQFDSNALLLAGDNIWHIDALSALFGKKATTGKVASERKRASRLFERWFHEKLLVNHDHGVLGALILLDNALKDENRPWVRHAALAIALHTWQGPDPLCIDCGRLRTDQFPLAFLLAFCDAAQEWGRKPLPERVQKLEPGVVRLTPDTTLQSVEVGGNKVLVQLQYEIQRDNEASPQLTLENVFNKVGGSFRDTWEATEKNVRFSIEGRVEGSMGTFGPAPIP
jgi:hypothetical protein